MSTSGVTSFTYNTNQYITMALRLLGVIGEIDQPSAEQYLIGKDCITMMLKHWESKGVFTSTESYGTLFLNVGQSEYQLGGSTPDKAATDPVVETQLTVTLSAAGTLATVNSTTGMTIGDNIGVLLDTGSIFWTTISNVNSSTTVTLNAGVTSQATSGSYVFSYTTQIGRPLLLSSVRCRRSGGTDSTIIQGTIETKLTPISRDTYLSYSNKYTRSIPSQYYIDRQNTVTKLTVYPVSSSSMYRLKFSYKRVFEDFVNSTDLADLPQEWTLAIVYGLAVIMAPIFEKEIKVNSGNAAGGNIRDQAMTYFNDIAALSQEMISVKFSNKTESY